MLCFLPFDMDSLGLFVSGRVQLFGITGSTQVCRLTPVPQFCSSHVEREQICGCCLLPSGAFLKKKEV